MPSANPGGNLEHDLCRLQIQADTVPACRRPSRSVLRPVADPALRRRVQRIHAAGSRISETLPRRRRGAPLDAAKTAPAAAY